MSARAVVFGATGTTGALTVRALLKRGIPMLLVGRNAAKLEALVAELGGGLEMAVADVTRPESLRAVVTKGDAVVSTVGPFMKLGEPAVRAAIDAGAYYFDSNGEPPFVRDVFERYGPEAAATGAALVTSFGNEYVPGNVVGALAARHAGTEATRIEVAYFITGRLGPSAASGATLQSAATAILKPAFTFRDGELVPEAMGKRRQRFPVSDGRRRIAVSMGASEHFGLPRQFPWLRDVDVYLGLDSEMSWGLAAAAPLASTAARVPGVQRALDAGAAHLKSSGSGPDEARRALNGVHTVGIARSASGKVLAEVHMSGAGAYEFTGELLAWGVEHALAGAVRGVGAVTPVEAYGLDELLIGCAESGLHLETP